MRTFLVVDRRTVVNEAYVHACRLRDKLITATSGILKKVADQLLSYGSSTPVSVAELRGGIYQDPSWCDSLTQPMIITSTVDQVGSRLLFRGYGVSNASRPMQAAAIAHDSIVILDEAHISKPFAQTLERICKYQQRPWADTPVSLPMRVVEMTATPQRKGGQKLEISDQELNNPSTHIGNIVQTPKRTKLEVAKKVKGPKAPEQLGKILAETACNYVTSKDSDKAPNGLKVVGVMVNTVATAKATYRQICTDKKVDTANVHLIIGAMRPVDREDQLRELRELISTGSDRTVIDEPIFVVSTQCIEVGADYDFDVLVTEAAPIDSLVQRFGRLNRAGRTEVEAVGHIVMRGDRVKNDPQLVKDDAEFKRADPIYGNAVSYSWNWLFDQAEDGIINFGIAAFGDLTAEIDESQREKFANNDVTAPVLLPAHLDLLCQTTFDPHPNPDVSLWLHGPQRNDAEVQVCWRADLLDIWKIDDETIAFKKPQWRTETGDNTADAERALAAISLCPPSSMECMSVRFVRLKQWLASLCKRKPLKNDQSADISAFIEDDGVDEQALPSMFCPLAWRGPKESRVITNLNEIRPGDTLVFPVFAEGWSELGFVPEFEQPIRGESGTEVRQSLTEPSSGEISCSRDEFQRACKIDEGARAFETSRSCRLVRIHPSTAKSTTLNRLRTMVSQGGPFRKTDLLELVALEQEDAYQDFSTEKGQPKYEFYDRSDATRGVVIRGTPRSKQIDRLPDDDGNDIYSRIDRGRPVGLKAHSEHVSNEVDAILKQIPIDTEESLRLAASCHDWGKSDPRFQAMLLGGDLVAAYMEDILLAKSNGLPRTRAEQSLIRERAELPSNFRHELLSMSLIETAEDRVPVEDFDLLLHLVAAHHGYARPWAPRSDDTNPPEIVLSQMGKPKVSLSADQRLSSEYDAVDSPIVSRFWAMNRKYGWWGLTFLESILRFADRRASQIESQLQADGPFPEVVR